MSNNTVYLITVIVFMAALAIIGIMISRGIKSQKDWMVAGKSLGIIPMAGTYFATSNSARYFYCETTATGYSVGELPLNMQSYTATMVVIY